MSDLNLKNFKKVKSDQKSTTFRDHRGHEIKIAHGHLSKKMQEDLQKIPHYNDGGEVEDDTVDREPATQPTPEQVQGAGYDPAYDATVPQGDTQSPAPAPQAQDQAPAPQAESQDVGPVTQPQAAQNQASSPASGIGGAYAKGIGTQIAGLKGAAEKEAIGGAGTQNPDLTQQPLSDIYSQGAQDITRLQSEAYKETGIHNLGAPGGPPDLITERANAQHDIQEGYVKPKDLFHDQSIFSKILTGVGLFLGGFGGGPNPMMEYLKRNQDIDIDAQKTNLHAKEGLLANNLAMYGNVQTGEAMARVNQIDYMTHQIQAQAAKIGSATAMDRANQLIGPLQAQAGLYMNLAQQSSQGGAAGYSDALQQAAAINPGLRPFAENIQKRLVPFSNQIAPKEVPEKLQNEITARTDYAQSLTRLRQFAQANSGSLNPAVIAQGDSLAAQASSKYRRAEALGVFRKGEDEYAGRVIHPDPTAFFGAWRTDPRYMEAERMNNQGLALVYKEAGVNPPAGSQPISSFRPKK